MFSQLKIYMVTFLSLDGFIISFLSYKNIYPMSLAFFAHAWTEMWKLLLCGDS